MGSMSDYADLLFAVADQTGYTGLSAAMPRLVRAAESKIQKTLRVAAMENQVTITPYSGVAKLPCDYLEARDVRLNGRKLGGIALRAVENSSYTGEPNSYYIVGDKIKVYPNGSGSLVMTYYAKIPSLVDEGENWLLDVSSEAYLYAVCKEVGIFKRNADLAKSMDELLQIELSSIRKNDERARWGDAKVVVRGVNP